MIESEVVETPPKYNIYARVCVVCREHKPAKDFEKDGTVCKKCKEGTKSYNPLTY